MSGLRPALAEGVGIRPWRHYFGRFDLSSRVAIHPGSRRRGASIEALFPPRAATPDELLLLDASSRPGEPAIEAFTTPALLREAFEVLDPDELPGPGSTAASAGWKAFAAEVAAFLLHVDAPLSRPYRLLLDVRDPEQPTPLLAGGPSHMLLDEGFRGGSAGSPGRGMAAYVNIGTCASALVFWNVPLPAMALRLAAEGVPEPADLVSMVGAFADRFPDGPLVRVALSPGEGVFVPFGLVAHDLEPTGAADLVVSLVALPGQ